MNFSKKKINMTIVVLLAVILLSATGLALATANGVFGNIDNDVHVSRDKTNVILSQDEENEKIVHVYLGMADDASVASFQIGLDIDVDDLSKVNFKWNNSLPKEEYKDYRYSTKLDESTGKNNERLNIYYVGTKELNTNDVDIIEVGTIEFDLDDEIASELVIASDPDFTTIASIAHNGVNVPTDPMDILQTKLNNTLIPLQSIKLSMIENTINVNDVFSLSVEFTPEETTDDKTIKWSSSEETVAMVDVNGEVTGLSEGVAYIYAQVGDLEPVSCKVTVKAPVITLQKIELSKSELTLKEGQNYESLTVRYLPDGARYDGTLEWKSSNMEVATVDNGKITALSAGETDITVKAVVGEETYEATCKVIVEKVAEDTIVIDTNDFDLSIGRERTLKVLSDTLDVSNVVWESSEPTVVSIDENGVVKALKEGNVTITARVGDKVATININAVYKEITSISIEAKNTTLEVGDTTEIVVNVVPEDASLPLDYTITSSDNDVVSINEDGTITAKKAGKSILTVKAASGAIGQVEIEVVEEIKDSPNTGDIAVGALIALMVVSIVAIAVIMKKKASLKNN